MNNFKTTLQNFAENTKKTFTNFKSLMSISKENISETDFFIFHKEFIEIHPRIFTMPFPVLDKIESHARYLNQIYGSNYFIWNVSEHLYDIALFNNQVKNQNQFLLYYNN